MIITQTHALPALYGISEMKAIRKPLLRSFTKNTITKVMQNGSFARSWRNVSRTTM